MQMSRGRRGSTASRGEGIAWHCPRVESLEECVHDRAGAIGAPTMNLCISVAAVVFVIVTSGCGYSQAERDDCELREVALPPREAVETASQVLASLGYELRAAGPGDVRGEANQNDPAERAVSVVGGVAATPFAVIADVFAGAPAMSQLTVSLAVNGGVYDTQLSVRAVGLDTSWSAVRAVAVVNGIVRPDWPQLAAFWAEYGRHARVSPGTDRARAAVGMWDAKGNPVSHHEPVGRVGAKGATGE